MLCHCLITVTDFDWVELEAPTSLGRAGVVAENLNAIYITGKKIGWQ